MKLLNKTKNFCLSQLLNEYRNLYNIEIETRQKYEQRANTNFTYLLIVAIIIAAQIMPLIERVTSNFSVCVFFVTAVLFIFQVALFYLGHFSVKLLYKEIDLIKVREMNIDIYSNKQNFLKQRRYGLEYLEEYQLLGYIRDSYLHCADHNRKVNLKRKKHLLLLDNLNIFNIILVFINYMIMYMQNGNILWITSLF